MRSNATERSLFEIEDRLSEASWSLAKVVDDLYELRGDISRPEPKEVIRSGPVTAVKWTDGTVTRTRCQEGDQYDGEKGFLYCVLKKVYPDTWHGVMQETCWDAAE